MAPKKLIDRIRDLEEQGVLYSESCPTPHYWHWLVKQPDLLPEDIAPIYKEYGEIRWYGSED